MAKFNIESMISKHTVDGNVDYAKINEELTNQNVNIVAKEVAKEAKKFDKDSIITEFLSENEFKSLDEFNAFKKNGATADTEAVKRLETELKAANDQLKTIPTLQNELSTYKNQALLSSKGSLTKDEIEFYEFKINKLDGETFEEKYNSFVENNPDVFAVEPPKPNVITTGAKKGNKVQEGSKLGWEALLEEKNPKLKL